MKTYLVKATRVGQWWNLDAPEVRFGASQCKRLDQAEEHIREAIAVALGVDQDSFDIALDIDLPAQVADHVGNLRLLEQKIEGLKLEAQGEVVKIVQSGITYRDAGKILGMSHQRVGQIVKEYQADDDRLIDA